MTVGLCGWEAAHVSEDKSEAIYEVVTKLVNLRQDLISRISHTEPGNVKRILQETERRYGSGKPEDSA